MDTHFDYDADTSPLYGSRGSLDPLGERGGLRAEMRAQLHRGRRAGSPLRAPAACLRVARPTERGNACAGIAARNCYGRAGFGVGYGGPAFS